MKGTPFESNDDFEFENAIAERLGELFEEIDIPFSSVSVPLHIHKLMMHRFLSERGEEDKYKKDLVDCSLEMLSSGEELPSYESVLFLLVFLGGVRLDDPELAALLIDYVRNYPRIYPRSAALIREKDLNVLYSEFMKILEIGIQTRKKTQTFLQSLKSN
jgi:hypothetical protein